MRQQKQTQMNKLINKIEQYQNQYSLNQNADIINTPLDLLERNIPEDQELKQVTNEIKQQKLNQINQSFEKQKLQYSVGSSIHKPSSSISNSKLEQSQKRSNEDSIRSNSLQQSKLIQKSTPDSLSEISLGSSKKMTQISQKQQQISSGTLTISVKSCRSQNQAHQKFDHQDKTKQMRQLKAIEQEQPKRNLSIIYQDLDLGQQQNNTSNPKKYDCFQVSDPPIQVSLQNTFFRYDQNTISSIQKIKQQQSIVDFSVLQSNCQEKPQLEKQNINELLLVMDIQVKQEQQLVEKSYTYQYYKSGINSSTSYQTNQNDIDQSKILGFFQDQQIAIDSIHRFQNQRGQQSEQQRDLTGDQYSDNTDSNDDDDYDQGSFYSDYQSDDYRSTDGSSNESNQGQNKHQNYQQYSDQNQYIDKMEIKKIKQFIKNNIKSSSLYKTQSSQQIHTDQIQLDGKRDLQQRQKQKNKNHIRLGNVNFNLKNKLNKGKIINKKRLFKAMKNGLVQKPEQFILKALYQESSHEFHQHQEIY